jgi:CHAD domain-containing protein
MHRKELVHIVEKRFSSLLSNWVGMQQLNKDAIHEWRVDYKKLRALIRLGAEHKKKLEIPSSLKEVYSVAGEIRDRQMQMERMLQWFGNETLFPPSYTSMLQKKSMVFGSTETINRK